MLTKLSEIGIICEVVSNDDRIHAWQPAMDIHEITVGLLMKRLDEHGSEAFKIDKEFQFNNEWEALIEIRKKEKEEADKKKEQEREEKTGEEVREKGEGREKVDER